MALNAIIQYFVPKDRKFFPLFEKASANLLATSNLLVEMVSAPTLEKRAIIVKKIEKLEHIGDDITHQIFLEVGRTFITPFDREDVQKLASALDEVLDFIHGSAKRMELYKMDPISPAMIKLAELTEQSCHEVNEAISSLRNMRNYGKIREALVKINSLENHADDIFDNAVAQLFEDEKDAIQIIKIKEVLSALETATDKCEDVANVLESVIIKHT